MTVRCCGNIALSEFAGSQKLLLFLRAFLRVLVAGVLFEILLREPVEGEGGNRAFKARSCHAPGAVRAAPAAEVIAVDPNQALMHVRLP